MFNTIDPNHVCKINTYAEYQNTNKGFILIREGASSISASGHYFYTFIHSTFSVVSINVFS